MKKYAINWMFTDGCDDFIFHISERFYFVGNIVIPSQKFNFPYHFLTIFFQIFL